MEEAFRRRLHQARMRHDLGRLLSQLADAFLAAGAAVLAAVVIGRATSVELLTRPVIATAAGLLVAVVGVRWYLTRPSLMRVALMIDERLALHERFSTTLALVGAEGPFVAAVRHEACARAASVDPARSFPIKLTRRWVHTTCCWAAAAAAFWFMPAFDLLGYRADAEQKAAELIRLEDARTEIKTATTKVEKVTSGLKIPEVAGDLQKLGEMQEGLKPSEFRRQAIRQLTDISDKLKKINDGEKGETQRTLKEMMKQLRSGQQGFADDLAKALQKGDFSKAAELAKELQKKLANGNLSEAERKALAEKLKDLAEQLEKLAANQDELEKALKEAGLDKKLAGLSEKDLLKKLKEAGLTEEQIKKLMEKAKACNNAGKLCKSLGKACSGCCPGMGSSSLSPEGLAALAEELNDLDALAAEMAGLEAALNEIEANIACLGKGQCNGSGQGLCMGQGKGPWAPGECDKFGRGSGGPGHGGGPVDTAEGGQVNTQGTRVQNVDKSGPVIGTWRARVEQVRGEASKEAASTVQAAKDSAAEAISENRIPARYQTSVKQYFDNLQGTGEDKDHE
ncbi:MAG: hypothetical protein JXL80_01945 [Planctomycetes bacterium]|nr:hypothetical protein [Planctomycetota bacterium]